MIVKTNKIRIIVCVTLLTSLEKKELKTFVKRNREKNLRKFPYFKIIFFLVEMLIIINIFFLIFKLLS